MRPEGVVKNVLVKIGEASVYTNFVVMSASAPGTGDVILLGRTFLTKLRSVMDIYQRTCTIEVDDKQHVLQAISDPPDPPDNSYTTHYCGLAASVVSYSQVRGMERRPMKGKSSTRRKKS